MSNRLAVRQTGALARRSVLDTLRLPQAWFPSIFFPLTLMAIFTGSFTETFSRVPGFPDVPSFLDFAVAGAIVQGILIGGTSAGAAFATDIEGGFFDRLVASPVSRAAILLGRLGGSVALGVGQAVLFIGIAVLFGARVEGGVAGFVLVLVLAAVFAVAVGGLGVYLALRTGSSEAVQGTFPLFFALMFFSSAFFPRETMDGWFRTIADLNPISYLVEGMRDLIIVGVEPRPTLISFGVALALAGAAVGASALAFRRRLGDG
jgi:ABC-2 type transport system permease protein